MNKLILRVRQASGHVSQSCSFLLLIYQNRPLISPGFPNLFWNHSLNAKSGRTLLGGRGRRWKSWCLERRCRGHLGVTGKWLTGLGSAPECDGWFLHGVLQEMSMFDFNILPLLNHLQYHPLRYCSTFSSL